MSGPPVVPPFRFRQVEEAVYAGAYPTLRNFRFLKRLVLKTIVSLTPEDPSYDLEEFCAAESINLKYISAEKFKDSPCLMPHDFGDVVSLLIDPEHQPVYMHCLDGGNACGQAIMILRKLMCWDTSAIEDEYMRWNTQGEVTPEEVAFLNEYNHPLLLPDRLPAWLWGGQPLKKPPIKVRTRQPVTCPPEEKNREAELEEGLAIAQGDEPPYPSHLRSSSQHMTAAEASGGLLAGGPPMDDGAASASLFKWWTSYPDKLKEQALSRAKAPSLELLGHNLQLGVARTTGLGLGAPPIKTPEKHSQSCSDLLELLLQEGHGEAPEVLLGGWRAI